MDPGTALGIVSLTIQVAKSIFGFIHDWNEMPQDVKEFVKELQLLDGILKQTRVLLENPEYQKALEAQQNPLKSQHTSKFNAPGGILEDYLQQLRALLDELRTERSTHLGRGWIRFRGAIRSKHLGESMAKANRHCTQIINMIAVDRTLIIAKLHNTLIDNKAISGTWVVTQESLNILNWISDLNFGELHADILSKRQPGTGNWLLESDEFLDWRNNHAFQFSSDGADKAKLPTTLWAHGIRKF